MQEETGYFSSFDGTKLFYRAWENDSPNTLIIIHGIGEHSGRYHEFIDSFGQLPFSVFALDLRGHGHSKGDRVYVNKFDNFIEDIYRFQTFISDKKAGKPRNFILLGQSLGGLIATHVVLKNQKSWNRLVLLSPFFGLPFVHPLGAFCAFILNLIGPKRVWKNPMRATFLTHDLDRVKLYLEDSLIQRRLSGRLASEMFKAISEVMKRAPELKIPLLILASGCDYIVSTSRTKRFFKRAGSSEKRIEIFDKYYHELLHETDRAKPIRMLNEYFSCLGLS